MSKKPARSLADVIARAAPPADEPAASPAAAASPSTARDIPLAQINIFLDAADRKRLRQLSIDADTSMQQLVVEGINLMLERRGLAPLKPVTANKPSGMRR